MKKKEKILIIILVVVLFVVPAMAVFIHPLLFVLFPILSAIGIILGIKWFVENPTKVEGEKE